MPKLAETGALRPLNDLIDQSGVDLNDFYPELLKIDRYDDTYYALPVSTNNLELFYNKDMFREAGLDPEDPPETWDELVEYAQKLTKPDGSQWGMELYTQTGEGLTWQFQVYLWQTGADFLTEDFSAPAFDSPGGEKALQFWVDLIHKYKVTPLAEWGLFGQGKAAMVMDGSWMVGIWAETTPFEWGTAPMPLPEGGEPATNMGGEHIFIFKSTPEQEAAAWDFVNWLTSTETQVKWDEETGFMPVRDSVAQDPGYQNWLASTEPRLKPFVDNQKYAHARPPITNYPEVSDAFSRELEKALHGTVTPAEALQSAAQAVTAVLGGKPVAAKPITLTFWNYWDGKNGEVIQELVDQYNAEHPNITVKNVYIGWGELLPKLQTAAAGGEMPDIAAGDMVWMPKLAETGALRPLNDFIDQSGVDLNDFYPELLKIDRYDDTYYALPVSTNNLELFYNKDMFREAGLDPEDPPETWDELVEYAQKLTKPDGSQWGMELYTQTGEGLTWQFQVYLWQTGADFLTEDFSAPAFDSPGGEKALQFWVDLIHKYKVTPLAEWGLFGQGKAAMVMDGSWMVGIWAETTPFEWGTAPMPLPEGGEPATNMGGEHIFIFKSTPEQEAAAWDFVNWLTSTETQVKWDEETGFMPVRDSVAQDPGYQNWLASTEPRLKPFVDNQKYAHARPPITNYPEVSDAFSRELEKALHGTVTPAEALQSAAQAVTAV
ncbi:MAG: ABC transporter substrate-binding protein, partial [Anaerolineae bacterium]|nr:ABC transporter substrate-binding protein [Anaerolineae bacterium]